MKYVKIDLDDLYLDSFVDRDGDRCVQWDDILRISQKLFIIDAIKRRLSEKEPDTVINGQMTIFDLLAEN